MEKLNEDRSRLQHPKMSYYKYVYQNSQLWNQEDLENKTIIVYGEQGVGDVIQFVRYVPDLMKRCKVILHCHSSLHRLFRHNNLGHDWLDRDCDTLPDHDFHIPMMSLPFTGLMESESPYLTVPELDYPDENFKIGIAWEGNPEHTNNFLRSCQLSLFKPLHDLQNTKLYMLHDQINDPQFMDVNDDFELFSIEKTDFYDTAQLVNMMDMVISVDTSILHLAGALGKKNTFGLLSNPYDSRWDVNVWYPEVTLVKDFQGDWKKVFRILELIARKRCNIKIIKKSKTKSSSSILITGGIGDYIALESHMTKTMRSNISRIYLASRANSAIKTLIPSSFDADVVEIAADYKKPFYQKSEVSAYFKKIRCPLPGDWDLVEDWSILVKFSQINDGVFSFVGSTILGSQPNFKNYITICPMTNTEVNTGRDFDDHEWNHILSFLESRNLQGVVIAGDRINCPEYPYLYNASGETTILESIGILQHSSGYLGIDSFLSILAAQKFSSKNILIKSINNHLVNNAPIYYASHKIHNFIVPCITEENLRRFDVETIESESL